MSKILVVADDLSGAAEMAGIGLEHGLNPRIVRGPGGSARDAELLVLDTDSRALSAADAGARVSAAIRQWAPGSHDFAYKKTDSVLRGNIATEIDAMLKTLARPAAILVPQNPSKGRVIVDGEYRINGVPLDQTQFRTDPESPITSVRPEQILAPLAPNSIHSLRIGEKLPSRGIIVGQGASADDIQHWASRVETTILPAGGADFFTALLQTLGHKRVAPPADSSRQELTLIVCGSASESSRSTVDAWSASGQPIAAMPDALFTAPRNDVAEWVNKARVLLKARSLAILAIRQSIPGGNPVDLRQCVARTVMALLAEIQHLDKSTRLFVEGGATAAAICDAAGWDKFDIASTIAPGVVSLRPPVVPRLRLIIKPGSYAWPAGTLNAL